MSESEIAPSKPPMARLPDPRKQPTSASTSDVGSSSASDAKDPQQRRASQQQQEEEKAKQKVISTELRDLLSRKVEKMEPKQIKDHGGGIN